MGKLMDQSRQPFMHASEEPYGCFGHFGQICNKDLHKVSLSIFVLVVLFFFFCFFWTKTQSNFKYDPHHFPPPWNWVTWSSCWNQPLTKWITPKNSRSVVLQVQNTFVWTPCWKYVTQSSTIFPLFPTPRSNGQWAILCLKENVKHWQVRSTKSV